MKILGTGMTARGVGSTRVRYDYVTFANLLVAALRELGHEVDQRVVTWGEDLDRYDCAFSLTTLIDSLGAQHVPGAAWTMRNMGSVCALYYDDWSCEKLAVTWTRKLGPYWDRYCEFKPNVGDLHERETLRETLCEVLGDKPRWPLLAPMFPFGDHEKMIKGLHLRLYATDPSGLVDPEIAPSPKARQWVLAALAKPKDDYAKKLRLTWPVVTLGVQPKGGGGVQLKGAAKTVVSEREVLKLYGQSWGVLNPPYASAGSGWWRARYNFAMAAGSILLCGQLDREKIGDAFMKSAWLIEGKTDQQLADLAYEQRALFHSKTWSKPTFMAHLNSFVRSLAKGEM